MCSEFSLNLSLDNVVISIRLGQIRDRQNFDEKSILSKRQGRNLHQTLLTAPKQQVLSPVLAANDSIFVVSSSFSRSKRRLAFRFAPEFYSALNTILDGRIRSIRSLVLKSK